MGKIITLEVAGWEAAIKGMRNPLKSYHKADSKINPEQYIFEFGPNDYDLAKRLCLAGSEHRKWMRMVQVWADFYFPRYIWEEIATYKIGTTFNSESTMHKLKDENFSYGDFEFPYSVDQDCDAIFKDYIDALKNLVQFRMNENKDTSEQYHQILKAMLPEGFIQKRTVNVNYETLRNMYQQRKTHRLPQWNTDFVSWIETLPYSEFITGKFDE